MGCQPSKSAQVKDGGVTGAAACQPPPEKKEEISRPSSSPCENGSNSVLVRPPTPPKSSGRSNSSTSEKRKSEAKKLEKCDDDAENTESAQIYVNVIIEKADSLDAETLDALPQEYLPEACGNAKSNNFSSAARLSLEVAPPTDGERTEIGYSRMHSGQSNGNSVVPAAAEKEEMEMKEEEKTVETNDCKQNGNSRPNSKCKTGGANTNSISFASTSSVSRFSNSKITDIQNYVGENNQNPRFSLLGKNFVDNRNVSDFFVAGMEEDEKKKIGGEQEAVKKEEECRITTGASSN